MKYLKIQNNGLLDIRLVALMGGTTKANDKYKIGQFGTGLKYTLAYLYRNNIAFKIFSGTEQVDITTEQEMIKDTPFEIICINGNRTSITTQMGLQWNAWMIIRELWCNALDEGGQLKETIIETEANPLVGKEDCTTFYIQITAEIQAVIDDWNGYFIQDYQPMWENENYAIHANDRKGKLSLYKNGVLIYQHPTIESLFIYDIKQAEINELREFKGHVSHSIFHALTNPGPDVASYFLNNIEEKHYEGSELDYDWFASFANVWKEAVGDRRIDGGGGYYESGGSGVTVDFSNVIKLPKKVYNTLVKEFEGIAVFTISDDKSEFYETDSIELKEKVAECISLLNACGYSFRPDVNIKYGVLLNKGLSLSSDRGKKSILISEKALDLSIENLALELIDKNEYISHGFDKKSHAYYQHFLSLYTRQLLAKNAIEI